MASLRSKEIKSIFVLGSTSEVAKSICFRLASGNCRHFHLVARNRIKNKLFAEELRNNYGVKVTEEETDLLDTARLGLPPKHVVKDFDLYLVTAGFLGDSSLASDQNSEACKIISANFTGVLPWLNAIATPERLQINSRLWIFSSVAGDRGRPSNYFYGAAKSALTIFCEGLFLRCYGKPFAVRIFKAGFMDTPMTKGKAPKVLCASPQSIARSVLRRPNSRGIEYLPWWWRFIMIIVRTLPTSIASKT